jgi:hypothetical protein
MSLINYALVIQNHDQIRKLHEQKNIASNIQSQISEYIPDMKISVGLMPSFIIHRSFFNDEMR